MPRPRVVIDTSHHFIDPGRITEATPAIDWPSFFGDSRPVELEIGSGKGLFLANAARKEPGVNYLGIELSRKYALFSAERLARLKLSNAKVWCGDGRLVLARLVPSESLQAVHVYFPDPWWKTRHKKRRVFTDALVSEIARALASGGLLNVASDVLEYFGVIRGLIEASEQFREEELPARADPTHPLDYLTHFERKYRLEGRSIYQARYRLQKT